MSKTILVCGHGPGISDAVARRYGAAGYAVAIVGRNAERLEKAALAMREAGLNARAFACDLGDAAAVTRLVAAVAESLPPIAILHWNAYAMGAPDLTVAPGALRGLFDVGVHGLLAALEAALPSLEATRGAVLVTGGGLGADDPKVNAMAVGWGAMGLAVVKATQHKLVGLLSAKLSDRGVYVGEVIVTGLVKGTAWDNGSATLAPETVAERFWALTEARSETTVYQG